MSGQSHPGPGRAGEAHHVPQPGRNGQSVGTGAPTGKAGFVNVGGRLFAPLQGLNPADVLQGGYGWCDLTDGGATYHPGADLNSGGSCNADEGLPVVAMLAGTVRRALDWDGVSSGEGNHLWLEVSDPLAPAPTWIHHDHLERFAVAAGQPVVAGQVIGYAGRTGNWDCAHLHTELLPAPPAQGWAQWPYGWSRAQVEAAYYPPAAWWRAASAKAQGAPEEVVVSILSGAQTAAVEAVMFGDYPFNPDYAIPTAWRDEWRRGVWRGRAISAEQPIPEDTAEGKPAGVYQLFEFGVCCWLPTAGASWTG